MLPLKIIAALVLAVGLVAPVQAGWDEARAAWKRNDYATVLREIKPLAKRGHARAQSLLGRLYENGLGVPRNYAGAAYWLHRSAKQGYVDAQLILGRFYEFGRGVPQNYVLAHMWFNLVAAQGNKKKNRWAAKQRNDLALKMTKAQIAEAQRLAAEFKPKPERHQASTPSKKP